MRRVWLWTLLVAVLSLVGTVGLSVLAHQPTHTTMAVEITESQKNSVVYYPVPGDLDVPKAGGYRPSMLVVTWDGNQWHAFSNRTDPHGCEVMPEQVPGKSYVLHEVCHGAIYELSGRWIAGPPRTLYAYPVREVKPGTLEVNLGQPTSTLK